MRSCSPSAWITAPFDGRRNYWLPLTSPRKSSFSTEGYCIHSENEWILHSDCIPSDNEWKMMKTYWTLSWFVTLMPSDFCSVCRYRRYKCMIWAGLASDYFVHGVTMEGVQLVVSSVWILRFQPVGWIMLDVSLPEAVLQCQKCNGGNSLVCTARHRWIQPLKETKFDLIMPYQHASFCGDVCNMLDVVVGRHRTASKKDSSRTWEKRCEDVVKLHLCISSSQLRSVWCWGMRSNASKPACKSWGHALGDCHRCPNISDTVHQEAYIAVSLVEAYCGHTRTHVYSTVTGWFVRPAVTSQSTPKSSVVISRYQDGVPSRNKM